MSEVTQGSRLEFVHVEVVLCNVFFFFGDHMIGKCTRFPFGTAMGLHWGAGLERFPSRPVTLRFRGKVTISGANRGATWQPSEGAPQQTIPTAPRPSVPWPSFRPPSVFSHQALGKAPTWSATKASPGTTTASTARSARSLWPTSPLSTTPSRSTAPLAPRSCKKEAARTGAASLSDRFFGTLCNRLTEPPGYRVSPHPFRCLASSCFLKVHRPSAAAL